MILTRFWGIRLHFFFPHGISTRRLIFFFNVNSTQVALDTKAMLGGVSKRKTLRIEGGNDRSVARPDPVMTG